MGMSMSTTSVSSRKRALPVRITVVVWLCVLAAFHSQIGIAVPRTGGGRIALLCLLLSLYLMWLSLAHTVVSSLFRLQMGHSPGRSRTAPCRGGSVAVLMCTRDDWRPDAAEWTLGILRHGDHLFVCDDSQHADSRLTVDEFVGLHRDRCTVVRRDTLEGFKAGNLNHCIAILRGCFPFVALVDHDTKLHVETLGCALCHFDRDESLAFVQFGLRHDDLLESAFARDLSLTVDVASWIQAVRSKYGVPLCIGRAVVFRSEAIDACGGFPTVISEDIGITLRLLRAGRRGLYEPTYPAAESVPTDYLRFRARQARWSVGTLQAWVGHSTRLPLQRWFTTDAVDILLQVLILWYPFVTLAFAAAITVTNASVPLPSRFVGVLLTTALMPFLPSIPLLVVAATPFQAIRAAVVHGAVFLSMIVSINSEFVVSLLSRRTEFANSGNRFVNQAGSGRSPRELFGANGWGTLATEIAVFVALVTTAERNEWFLLPLQAGLGAGVVFRLARWESMTCRIVSTVPLMACAAVAARISRLLA